MKNLLGSLLITLFFASSMVAQDGDKTAASLYNEGLALLKEKKYEEGLPLLEQALEKATADGDEKIMGLANKNGSVAAYSIGNAKRKAGMMDEALAMYEKGIAMSPQKDSNHSGVAMIYAKQGKKEEAVAKYMEAAMLAEKAEKPKRAAKYYKKTQNLIGKFYIAKDYPKAIELGKGLLAKTDNAEVNYYVARSLNKTDAHADGLTYASKSIELTGDKAKDKYYIAKAESQEGTGDKAGAIESYKMVKGEKYKAKAEGKIKQLQG